MNADSFQVAIILASLALRILRIFMSMRREITERTVFREGRAVRTEKQSRHESERKKNDD
jgi:hypothetical protein